MAPMRRATLKNRFLKIGYSYYFDFSEHVNVTPDPRRRRGFLRPTDHGVGKAQLQVYLDEFAFQPNANRFGRPETSPPRLGVAEVTG